MPRPKLSIAAALLINCVAWTCAWADGVVPELPEAFLVRQMAFTLPFRLEPPRNPSEQPAEVQLYLSSDKGATWQLHGRVKPDAGKFVVQCPRDGEYWFCIRTVDAQNITRPEGAKRAELRVVIDTIPPRLEITADQGPAGEVIARWQVVDPNLQGDSFKLEYQSEPSGNWERLAIDSSLAKNRASLAGTLTWWPKSGAGPILVRASVADRAGNPAVSQAKLGGPSTAAAAPGATTPGATTPGTVPRVADRGPTNWPADKFSDQPLTRLQSQSGGLASDDSHWTHGTGAQNVSVQKTLPSGEALNLDVLPPGERPRMVNSRSFELEYEVETVGPSGIARVELWGTRDGGRTWTSFGLDSDNRSPFMVSVEGEGVYGFRVVFQSGTGFGGLAPREGELADLWIAVDLTEPKVKILGADPGRDAGELVVRWEGVDKMPAAHPISLSFSAQPRGPWTPIASDLENTGSYGWRLDNRVPEQVYLRIELRDEAGNLGRYETPTPIPLDRQRPQGRIRNVRPVRQSARAASKGEIR